MNKYSGAVGKKKRLQTGRAPSRAVPQRPKAAPRARGSGGAGRGEVGESAEGRAPPPRTRRRRQTKGPPRPRLCPRRRPSARRARARPRLPAPGAPAAGPVVATHPQGGEVDVHQTFCRGVVRHFPFLPPNKIVPINISVSLFISFTGQAADCVSSQGSGRPGLRLARPGAAAAAGWSLLSAGPGRARRADGACASGGSGAHTMARGGRQAPGRRPPPQAPAPAPRAPRRAPGGRARSVGPRRRRELSE